MQELTIKANIHGSYDVIIDNELQKDLQAISIEFDMDKHLYPEINMKKVMFISQELTRETFEAYESGVVAQVLKLKEENNDEMVTEDIQRSDKSVDQETTE